MAKKLFRKVSSKRKTTKVIKRDGRAERFQYRKMLSSIRKAMAHAHVRSPDLAESLAKEAVGMINRKYKGKPVPVEAIKETVEFVLVKNKLPNVAKAYILYRYM